MSAPDDEKERIRQSMAAIWQRSLPLIQERLDALDHAAELAAAGTLTAEDRQAAASNAHKLAGSVGMFGYMEGTELARRLETTLEAEDLANPLLLRELSVALRAALAL
jgi:chemotaxis protein histidine kinase CheA